MDTNNIAGPTHADLMEAPLRQCAVNILRTANDQWIPRMTPGAYATVTVDHNGDSITMTCPVVRLIHGKLWLRTGKDCAGGDEYDQFTLDSITTDDLIKIASAVKS